ncbi:hypothetical protein ZIOFF_011615 [Zingiber officinale]|uniref:Uncharacterized protein n=1 Tax=Zingiber officinale TaxID=94328 RepID=A0A8J5I6D1_ZINOF|nr:hypothetical protein ZIOFF_011615 [Zingiber officinale]
MSLPSSSTSKEYLEALENTEVISNPTISFIFAKDAGVKDINRQNNTIIELLLSINAKLDLLIKKPVDTNNQVADLAKQLEGLNLGKARTKKPEPFFVYKDPLKILKEEKEKLKKDEPKDISQEANADPSNSKNYSRITRNEVDIAATSDITRYQSTGNPWLSRVNEKDIEDINEEEFVAPCFTNYPEIWDTLGEPSGRNIRFQVSGITLPGKMILNGILMNSQNHPPEPKIQELEDDPETYFIGLQNLETDYPAQIPDTAQQPMYWESSDTESEAYWQQVVQHVEQIEAQLQPPLTNGWYDPIQENMIIEEFLDRIPQGLPGGTWYEFYGTGSEQNDDQQNPDTNN